MRKNRRLLFIIIVVVLLPLLLFLLYSSDYYRADETAEKAMTGTDQVNVSEIREGWLFDGPGNATGMVFYPGGKVEETAYAPLLSKLAENGIDVYLMKMPFHLVFFGLNKADDIINAYQYDHWYIAGHSLGGVGAGFYADRNSDRLDGIILLASYTTKKMDDDLITVSVYGTEDGVLNREGYQKNLENVSAHFTEHVIKGGNHAQFGSYGPQKKDKEAKISAPEQVEETVNAFMDAIAGNQ